MRRRDDRPIYLDERNRPTYLPELGPRERYPVLFAQLETAAVCGACGWMLWGWQAPLLALVCGGASALINVLLWGLR